MSVVKLLVNDLYVDRFNSDLMLKRILSVNNLSLSNGELAFICGPSGAGKSTFLYALANVIDFTGKIDLYANEKLLTDRSITFVPQDFSAIVNPDRTVRNILMDYEKEVSDSAFVILLKMFNIYHIQDKKLKYCSGGQKQRITLLSNVLNSDTKLILLDEPLAALDVVNRRSMLLLLNNIASILDKIVILSIHDIFLAAEFAKRIFFISEGELFEVNLKNLSIAEKIKKLALLSGVTGEDLGYIQKIDQEFISEVASILSHTD